MSNKKEKERFSLVKIKVEKDEALSVHYEYKIVEKEQTYIMKELSESPIIPHPDLLTPIRSLASMVARIYHFTFIREMIINPEFNATSEQASFAERELQSILEKIKVTGISLSGAKDNTRGCVITAIFSADEKSKMAINTHRIIFSRNKYGFEEDLKEICDTIEEEAFAYLFENKQAQLELFPNEKWLII